MKAHDRERLVPFVRQVLESAACGKGPSPHYLTAYQILDRLPPVVRDELIREHGRGGLGAGEADTAPRIVSEVLRHELAGEVHRTYLDARGARFSVAGDALDPGYPVIGLYRLRRDHEDVP